MTPAPPSEPTPAPELPDAPWLSCGRSRRGGVVSIDALCSHRDCRLRASLILALYEQALDHPACKVTGRLPTLITCGARTCTIIGIPNDALPHVAQWAIENIGPELETQRKAAVQKDVQT